MSEIESRIAIAYLPAEPTVCLTLRPFLHPRPNSAGAQARSRCKAPYGGTILTAP